MDLKETGCQDVDWIHFAQNGVGSCQHGNELLNSIKGREFLD